MTQAARPIERPSQSSRRSLSDKKKEDRTKTVAKGDTLSHIAQKNGLSLEALLRANPQIKNPDLIHPGQSIRLPAGQSSSASTSSAKRAALQDKQARSRFEQREKNPFASDETTHVSNASKPTSQAPLSMNFGPAANTNKPLAEKPLVEKPKAQEAPNALDQTVQDTVKTVGENLEKTVEKKKEESKSILNRLPNQIKNQFQRVQDTIQGVQQGVSSLNEAAQSGERAWKGAMAKGKAPHEALQAGIGAYGESLYNNTIDRWLDQSVLGPDTAANDKATGALGPLLTNRLGVGESVNIDLARGSTLPTMLLGAPNLTVEEGGQLSMKRVAALDENNKPILDPKTKKPQTRLEVELQMRGRVAGDYRAEVGFEAKGQALGHQIGAEAKASATVEAGATGNVGIRMRIDPNNPAEMSRLSSLIGVAKGIDPSTKLPDHLKGIGNNVEAIYGEGGLYAQAMASATAKAGIFKTETNEEAQPASKTQSNTAVDKLRERVKGKTKEELEKYHNDVVNLLGLDVASISTALGGHINVGRNQNFRTNESSLTFELGGKAGASASLLGFGGGKKAEATKKLEMIFDQNGKLTNIHLKEKFTKESFIATKPELESLYGKTITGGFLAKLDKSKSIEVQMDLKPEALATIQKRLADKDAGKTLQFAKALFSGEMKRHNFTINPSGIVATESHNATIQGKLGVSILAKLGLSGILSLGHSQEFTPNQ